MSNKMSLVLTEVPEIIQLWDFNRNSEDPNKITVGSHKVIWWVCTKGHSWEGIVSNIMRGDRCPYCSGRRVSDINSLLTTFPGISLQWDYSKNKGDPKTISFGSHKKVWWFCAKGHSWEAVVKNRTRNGVGCPYCSNQKVGYGNDLLTNCPVLCEQWDYDKNTLSPGSITPGSNFVAWWKCYKNHSWDAIVHNRALRRSGCPYCSGSKTGYGNDLLTNHPKLCKEWDFEKNFGAPDKITPGSNKRVWWKCSLEHSWKAVVAARVGGTGCPFCSGGKVGYNNDLLYNFPGLCLEWDYQSNKSTPNMFTPGSGVVVGWVCGACGLKWKAPIYRRTVGHKCPECASRNRVSEISQVWLDQLGVVKREVHLKIPGSIRGITVDGFDPETNTIYEFFGDYWHGNPKVYKASGLNGHNGIRFGDLYKKTLERVKKIRACGYKLVFIWEQEFRGEHIE